MCWALSSELAQPSLRSPKGLVAASGLCFSPQSGKILRHLEQQGAQALAGLLFLTSRRPAGLLPGCKDRVAGTTRLLLWSTCRPFLQPVGPREAQGLSAKGERRPRMEGPESPLQATGPQGFTALWSTRMQFAQIHV